MINFNELIELLVEKSNRVLIGPNAIMPTNMIGMMEMLLPTMYIMNKFIGNCLSGPIARSHDF